MNYSIDAVSRALRERLDHRAIDDDQSVLPLVGFTMRSPGFDNPSHSGPLNMAFAGETFVGMPEFIDLTLAVTVASEAICTSNDPMASRIASLIVVQYES